MEAFELLNKKLDLLNDRLELTEKINAHLLEKVETLSKNQSILRELSDLSDKKHEILFAQSLLLEANLEVFIESIEEFIQFLPVADREKLKVKMMNDYKEKVNALFNHHNISKNIRDIVVKEAKSNHFMKIVK